MANLSLNDEARAVAKRLQDWLDRAEVAQAMIIVAARVTARVSADQIYAFEVPEDIAPPAFEDGTGFPVVRVAAFWPGAVTTIERHPNSRQFLYSLAGQGETRLLEGDGPWRVDAYGTGPDLADHWHLTEAGMWHQSVATGDVPWQLIAFHSAENVIDDYAFTGPAAPGV